MANYCLNNYCDQCVGSFSQLFVDSLSSYTIATLVLHVYKINDDTFKLLRMYGC